MENGMCGIVGFLDRRGHPDRPLGGTLLAMLQALACRGPDSTGAALFHAENAVHLNLSVPVRNDRRDAGPTVADRLRDLGLTLVHDYRNGTYRVRIPDGTEPVALEAQLREVLPGAEVLCLGTSLRLVKQVGSPAALEAAYGFSAWKGTHGIGHTRLSTESRVDLSHSQPFWAHGVRDLATVHNGHITNYHKLRRHYEQKGYRFYTENDSEVIGVYLRDRLAAGLSLADALRSSLDDFDGSYCYLAASGDQLAYVKDRFGFKPLVLAQTDDFVALATEEIALRQALGRDFPAVEPAPGTMRLWTVTQEVRHVGADRAQ
jgi:glutamine phosphoribosylpyrophosphate amidotransferase